MATILSSPYSYFSDANGNPLAGGKVYTYTAGTSTPLATYTDSTLTTPNANPVILDSAGRAVIWLSGTYKITVTDSADVVIRTVDNIAGTGANGDMLKATYDPANIQEQLVGLTAVQVLSNKTLSAPIINNPTITGYSGNLVNGQISGFLPSSISGTSTTASLTISTGQAVDTTVASRISKDTTTSWSVSNGNAINGYSGGTTLPNSSTIHFFMCSGGSGTGSFASTSLTPTLPTGYDTYYRRVFSIVTTGAGAPIPYTSTESCGGAAENYLSTITGQTISVTTSDALYTLTGIPSGIKVIPIMYASLQTNGNYAVLYSDTTTSAAPAVNGTAPGITVMNQGGQIPFHQRVITNTSSQIRARANSNDSLYVYCHGWQDFRR